MKDALAECRDAEKELDAAREFLQTGIDWEREVRQRFNLAKQHVRLSWMEKNEELVQLAAH